MDWFGYNRRVWILSPRDYFLDLTQRYLDLVIMLVQNNKKELRKLISCVASVFPKDVVVGFDNPDHALSYAESKQVDICFADVEMDSTTGFALTRELRDRNENIRVSLMADNSAYALDAWRFHVNDYLVKPVTKDSVLHTVEACNL